MISGIHDLKQQVFYDLMDLAGRVFMLVTYSEDVIIGDRGFLPEEKQKGLVLVFNSRMKFKWDDAGISAKLVFGSAPQECFIPNDSILSVFSPELSAQFMTAPGSSLAMPKQSGGTAPSKSEKPRTSDREHKVVEVDFRKKR